MLLSKLRLKLYRARLTKQGRRWKSTKRRSPRLLKIQGLSSAKATVEQQLEAKIIILMIYSITSQAKMNQTTLQSNKMFNRSMCLSLEEDTRITNWERLASLTITYQLLSLTAIIRKTL
jgi:hypothetical protein